MIVVSPLADSYSQALFDAALQANILDQVAKDVETLLRLREEQPKLRDFLGAPNISISAKENLITKLLEVHVHPMVLNFSRMIIRRGRIDIFLPTMEGFKMRYRKHNGIAKATVTSAVNLTSDQRERLQKELQRRTGLKFETEYIVDPSIIGGVRFKSGDTLIDTTLRRGLEQMRAALHEARVI